MVKTGINRKRLILICVFFVLLLVFVCVKFNAQINKWDAENAAKYENQATRVGIERAKKECAREALMPTSCEHLSGFATTSECRGATCWIVHIRSNTSGYQGASIVVEQGEHDSYVITDYSKNE